MAQRALLVGIDQYPNPQNNLNSCVADTLAFKNRVLQDRYGFDPANVQLLHNQAATLANVRQALGTLFQGVGADDEIVYFESSHGYRYPKGDTMVEVLCLYDAFMEDQELVKLTQPLPPGVLTVVLDACHSGGMEKLFFPPDGPAVARAKVFRQDPIQAAIETQLLQQVTRFKFFGRAETTDTGAVAKAFSNPGSVPRMKDIGEGQLELNGALFAACKAEETAAAGSPATNNLSAFTFGLIDQLDSTISLNQLCQQVVTRLKQLNMRQTPTAEAPVTHQEFLSETFVTMRPAADGGMPGPIGAPPTRGPRVDGVPPGFDPDAWRRAFGLAA
jgi:hypothetical protein